jgi:hypothetical protein
VSPEIAAKVVERAKRRAEKERAREGDGNDDEDGPAQIQNGVSTS